MTMSEELKYIDYDGALEVYRKTVAASGGGLQGVKDEGGIRKVLDFVQNDLYYPTFVEKLTYLVFGLCTGQSAFGFSCITATIGTPIVSCNAWKQSSTMSPPDASTKTYSNASSPTSWQTKTIPKISNSKSSTLSAASD